MLRLLKASGESVYLRGPRGSAVEVALPMFLRNLDVLDISPAYVVYGERQDWLLSVYVDDVTGTPLTKLCVIAIYDDTVTPDATEDFVKDSTLQPNAPGDYPKALTIPEGA
jgi:hypothetical protein